MMQDIADQDQLFYDSLTKLADVQDIDSLFLDFTVTENVAGKPSTVELVPDGANKSVTTGNVQDYCHALLRYRMMENVRANIFSLFSSNFPSLIPKGLHSMNPLYR